MAMEVIDPADTGGIVEGMVPYFTDQTDKTKYLSYRSVGFNVHESCSLAKVSYRTVMRWRAADERFKSLDLAGLSELRDQVGNNYLRMEWGRNFRLVLDKDRQVLEKAVKGKLLTKSEEDYLGKIRGQYTPQAFQVLEQIFRGEDENESFDLTRFVLNASRDAHSAEITMRVER